mmetsp:Transcript_112983/g.243392  ORF Transcript_112983/g.243392 Transcript_112983/m.243392 type:complete len:485 (-) Transcript_112983:46-1500(-)
MIHYHQGRWGPWGILFICRSSGSVIPQALVWAVPSAIFAGYLHLDGYGDVRIEGVGELWSGYTFILGFLLVFRNNQAYSRFWEGATLIQQVRGEWFNAVSSLIAFCSKRPEKREEVEVFQHLLVRLMSMLYCAALQQVAVLDDNNFDIIDNEGMDTDSLLFLAESNDRCEIILQWIQRLVVDAQESGVISVAPPILSRSFQELSRGIVNLNNVRKIKEIPFPFPYAQASTVMLLVHWIITPIFASQYIASWWSAAIVSLVVSCAFWAISYIAQEIEQPFGEDPNDLPMAEMQSDMNRSLRVLLQPLAQHPPRFNYLQDRDAALAIRKSDLDLLFYETRLAEDVLRSVSRDGDFASERWLEGAGQHVLAESEAATGLAQSARGSHGSAPTTGADGREDALASPCDSRSPKARPTRPSQTHMGHAATHPAEDFTFAARYARRRDAVQNVPGLPCPSRRSGLGIRRVGCEAQLSCDSDLASSGPELE